LKIQEIQEDTVEDSGRTPRTLDIEATTTDLVDICTAGDTIQVSGILKAVNTAMASGRGNKKVMQETSTYKIYLAANCIINTTKNNFEVRKKLKQSKDGTVGGETGGGSSSFYTSEQLETITKVAYADHMYGPMNVRMAFPFDLLVRSICPAIIGHDMVKAGILLALLGGTPTNNGSTWDGRYGNQIRSSIHILIVGDPGT
jgi:DNA helicase MCM8